MSAKNKINPDHYKTGHPGSPRETPKDAGERETPKDPGDAPVKRRNKNTSADPNFIPGAAPVGETEEGKDEKEEEE
jgi:hypothetical protein